MCVLYIFIELIYLKTRISFRMAIVCQPTKYHLKNGARSKLWPIDNNLNYKHNIESIAFDLYSKQKHPNIIHGRPNLTVEALFYSTNGKYLAYSQIFEILTKVIVKVLLLKAFNTINHCTNWHEPFVSASYNIYNKTSLLRRKTKHFKKLVLLEHWEYLEQCSILGQSRCQT